ncbi:hypothetical protein [Synechococcus phage MA01]
MSTVARSRSNTKLFTNLRRLANFLVLVGYYVLLNVDMTTGIIIRIVSALLVIPWMINNKVWDGVFVMSIMTSIDVHKLLYILLGL